MKILMCAGIVSAFFLTGCQGLNDVNSALGALNSALGTVTGTSGGTSGGGVYVTPKAKASVSASLSKARSSNTARKLFNEAKPSIEKVVGLIACGAKGSQMGAYTDSSSFSHMFPSPFDSMSYHKSGCLDILRVNSIQRKAANAVKFSVDYVSSQSQESARRSYSAIKQPDGEWLFDWHP